MSRYSFSYVNIRLLSLPFLTGQHVLCLEQFVYRVQGHKHVKGEQKEAKHEKEEAHGEEEDGHNIIFLAIVDQYLEEEEHQHTDTQHGEQG